jgi:hypothetical protein
MVSCSDKTKRKGEDILQQYAERKFSTQSGGNRHGRTFMRRTMTAALSLILVVSPLAPGAPFTTAPGAGKAIAVSKQAKGSFDVKVTPIKLTDPMDTGGFGRLALAKTFQGDLSGTSVGMMLGSTDAAQTSGGYVALEKVTGTLQGKTGSFVLMHNGTMTPQAMEMRIMVVPASGTGELEGIAGVFKIIIEGKKHFWEFEYTLP